MSSISFSEVADLQISKVCKDRSLMKSTVLTWFLSSLLIVSTLGSSVKKTVTDYIASSVGAFAILVSIEPIHSFIATPAHHLFSASQIFDFCITFQDEVGTTKTKTNQSLTIFSSLSTGKMDLVQAMGHNSCHLRHISISAFHRLCIDCIWWVTTHPYLFSKYFYFWRAVVAALRVSGPVSNAKENGFWR